MTYRIQNQTLNKKKKIRNSYKRVTVSLAINKMYCTEWLICVELSLFSKVIVSK